MDKLPSGQLEMRIYYRIRWRNNVFGYLVEIGRAERKLFLGGKQMYGRHCAVLYYNKCICMQKSSSRKKSGKENN